MSVALRIKDETSTGEVISESVIRFPADKITVRELIEGRVVDEVEKYNASLSGRFIGLIQPSDSEAELNGFKLKRGKPVDPDKQKEIAIDAFNRNGFFLLVNDKQVCDLEEPIIITPNTTIAFVKLIPLVGG